MGASLSGLARRVLGERALAAAEDLVTGREAGHLRADGLDAPGAVPPRDRPPRPPQPDGEPDHVRLARHQVPDVRADPGRMHADEHFLVAGHGAIELAQPEHVGGAICALHDRSHRVPARRHHDLRT